MKRLIVMKIGGSVITDKSRSETARHGAISQFAENLAAAVQAFPDVDILLGNGAGSFGHHSAHQYGLADGAHTAKQFYGVGVTHNSVRMLNAEVGNALTSKNIPAYCLSPGDIFTAKNGAVTQANQAVVEELLRQHAIPLIHGDTVVDTERGVSIFSTEKSLFWFAKALRSQYDRITIVMVVNTGGVLDERGGVIPELTRSAIVEIAPDIAGTKDVTGGIVHKVAVCREAAEWADAVYIVGNTKSDILATCAGTAAGTKVL